MLGALTDPARPQPEGYQTMTKTTLAFAAALLFGLMLSAGSVVAGDGKSCGDKKKDGGTALIESPARPLA
jgi:hypothetical protein